MRPNTSQSEARLLWTALLGAALVVGCAVPGTSPAGSNATPVVGSSATPPYAGLQERAIKALAPERVTDLRVGRGASYALAAELNHYPGPSHVLELKDQLALRPEQERATRDLFTSMQRAARTVGDQLLDLEVQLDASFASGRATTAEVARLTAEIAAAEGRLRAVHLSTHLDQKAILTADQVARYDQLRGYSGQPPVVPTQHGQGVSHGGR